MTTTPEARSALSHPPAEVVEQALDSQLKSTNTAASSGGNHHADHSHAASKKVQTSGEVTKVKSTGQGLFTVWHGLTFGGLLQLMAKRPRMHYSRALRLVSLFFICPFNSFYSIVSGLIYGRKIQNTQVTKPPIFILGHWRSGTTLLHNLMTLDSQFTYPNLYQVMYPQHFLLTESVISKLAAPFLPKTRPMDNMPAGWKLPQEDEVALLIETQLSPYLMVAFPNERKYYGHTFDVRHMSPSDQAKWKRSLVNFVKKLTVRTDKPIVMKSPSHTYRVATLLELFPDARFVYIHRDPYAVFSSSLHLRRTMYMENSFIEPTEENLYQDTLETLDTCLKTYEETRHMIPEKNLVEIRYSDLEAHPVEQMQRVYETLGFEGWERMQPIFEREAQAMSEYKKNRFIMDDETRQMIYSRLKDFFDKYGYDPQISAGENGSKSS